MAFDWKKKFEDGKKKAAGAFANAVVKGEELLEKGEKAAAEFGAEVKAKVDELKKKDGGPKNGG